jgi:hypothetical protein
VSQQVYEKVRDKYRTLCDQGAPREIARVVREAVGVVDADGQPFRSGAEDDDEPILNPKRKVRATQPGLLEAVTKGIVGDEWKRVLCEGRGLVSEEAVAAIGPSVFVNVAAWTAAVGGLVQGSIMEGYFDVADFELSGIFPVRPPAFWQGGERLVAIIGPSRPAPKVGPGQSHPDVRMDAMWVEPGPMAKYGHKITVAKETAYIDITGGQILRNARQLGFGLRYRDHELTLDVIVGQTNNFKLGLTNDASATGYNTYGATVPTGGGTTGALGNDIVNPMTDPLTTFNASQTNLLGYKHPVTGLPMPYANRLTTLILPSSLQWFATYLNTAGQIQVGSVTGAPFPQIGGTTFPTNWVTGPNPFAGLFKDVRVSQWIYTRHLASTTQPDPDLSPGLGLSAANSNRWYRLDPSSFAMRRVAWDVDVNEVPPSSFPMLDQGLVFGAVANIGVQIQITNIWAIQRNKVV